MARQPRVHVRGGFYHVIVRGNGGQPIFLHDADHLHLYQLLQEGTARFGYRVHGFCCMPNHLHLALQVGQVPLSKIMQNLSVRYTGWLNRRTKRMGHLFQGRYKALLVDADAYLLALIRYIHRNPVRAALVKEPADYRWSGHRAYVGLESLPWLTTDWVLSLFESRAGVARTRYEEFVDRGSQEGHRKEFHRGGEDARILGDEEFIHKALERESAPTGRRVSFDRVVARVCQVYRLPQGALRGGNRNRVAAEARAVIGYLAVETGCATLTDVARRFGRDVSTLSKGVQRVLRGVDGVHAEYQDLLAIGKSAGVSNKPMNQA